MTCVRGITRSVSARRWEGDGFDHVLLLLCQIRDINSISRGNALAATRTRYHVQLGLPDKGRAIKGSAIIGI